MSVWVVFYFFLDDVQIWGCQGPGGVGSGHNKSVVEHKAAGSAGRLSSTPSQAPAPPLELAT